MEYFNPGDLNEAYEILMKYGDAAIPVAGSTFFMGHREELFDEVDAVVNIKRLGLSYIRLEKGRLCIGATTTLAELHRTGLTAKGPFRIFAETVRELKIMEVRNAATIGGEVCIAGEVDMPTTLLAYDADIVIGSRNGTRTVSMSEFHKGYLKNALQTGEMVIEVQVPEPGPRTGGGFAKFERTAADLPIVNAAVRLTLGRGDRCSDVRVAVGAATAAGIPQRADAAEKILLDGTLDDEHIRKAAAASNSVKCVNDFRASAELRTLWVECAVEDAIRKALTHAGEEK